MALSRRLRFEILRRDGHTCRYCGAMAPDAKLTVDHVVPVALGGSDEPANLVTACADCNGGKSSIQPGSDLVADIEQDALRWARALEAAAHNMLAEREVIDGQLARFVAQWERWTYPHTIHVPAEPLAPTGDPLIDKWRLAVGWPDHCRPVSFAEGTLTIQVADGWRTYVRQDLKTKRVRKQLADILGAEIVGVEIAPGWPGSLPRPPQPTTKVERRTIKLPAGWESSVERFISLGLPESEMVRFIDVAMNAPNVARDDTFRYFCGCCWRTITDLQEDARRFIEAES